MIETRTGKRTAKEMRTEKLKAKQTATMTVTNLVMPTAKTTESYWPTN